MKYSKAINRWLAWNLIGLIILVLGGCSGTSVEGTLPLQKCLLDEDLPALCGSIQVAENRENPGGRMLDLHFAVLQATTNQIASAPLFLLAGGPGQPAITVYPPLISLFESIRQTHDIILLDQRGTGRSSPLRCSGLTDTDLAAQSDEEILAVMEACVAELSPDRDLTHYTTAEAIQDLDEVRAALGYEQVNLYGSSYGTRAAVAYAQTYPDRVRTLVLDAVAGPDLVLYLQMPRDGQRSLDLLVARCEKDPACQEHFPSFAAELSAIYDALAEPRQVSIEHPATGLPVELELTQAVFSQTIFNLLYSPEIVSLLPLLVHHTYEQDNYGRLLAQSFAFSGGNEINIPLLYAVTCAEDAPLIELDEARELWAAGTDFFSFVAEDFIEVCAFWPRQALDPNWRDTSSVRAPTLLLSGEGDPVTPPIYAAELAANLPESLHLVVPGGGHGSIVHHCVYSLVNDFIQEGTLADLESDCVEEISPPPFFIDFNGAAP